MKHTLTQHSTHNHKLTCTLEVLTNCNRIGHRCSCLSVHTPAHSLVALLGREATIVLIALRNVDSQYETCGQQPANAIPDSKARLGGSYPSGAHTSTPITTTQLIIIAV